MRRDLTVSLFFVFCFFSLFWFFFWPLCWPRGRTPYVPCWPFWWFINNQLVIRNRVFSEDLLSDDLSSFSFVGWWFFFVIFALPTRVHHLLVGSFFLFFFSVSFFFQGFRRGTHASYGTRRCDSVEFFFLRKILFFSSLSWSAWCDLALEKESVFFSSFVFVDVCRFGSWLSSSFFSNSSSRSSTTAFYEWKTEIRWIVGIFHSSTVNKWGSCFFCCCCFFSFFLHLRLLSRKTQLNVSRVVIFALDTMEDGGFVRFISEQMDATGPTKRSTRNSRTVGIVVQRHLLSVGQDRVVFFSFRPSLRWDSRYVFFGFEIVSKERIGLVCEFWLFLFFKSETSSRLSRCCHLPLHGDGAKNLPDLT